MIDKNEIINRISYLRTRAHLSARALSFLVGKNGGYINRLEAKKDFLPTIETLLEIISACNSSVEEFFYKDINSYKKDSEIIELLANVKEEKKEAIITLLKN